MCEKRQRNEEMSKVSRVAQSKVDIRKPNCDGDEEQEALDGRQRKKARGYFDEVVGFFNRCVRARDVYILQDYNSRDT